jgi:hypothetical protein
MKEFQRLSHSDLEKIERNCVTVFNSNAHFRKISADLKASYDPVRKTFYRAEGYRFKGFKKRELIQLITMFQFSEDDFIKFYFLSEMQDYLLKARGLEDLIFLTKKETFKKYLSCSTRMERRFMLSIFKEEALEETLNSFSVKVIKARTSTPKRLIRHKGYRDHGSLPEISEKALREEIRDDISLRLKQVQKWEYDDFMSYFLELHYNFLKTSGESESNYYFEKEIEGGFVLCYKKN